MIENMDQMRSIVEDAIGGKCYLEHPQGKISKTKPFAVLSLVHNAPTLTEYDHTDVMALLVYNIHIYAQSQTELLTLVGNVSDACAKYNFLRTALTPVWSHPTHGPYRILTVQAQLDKRGNATTLM